LNYYIIESIYQYVFNNIDKSLDFPYLDEWCPRHEPASGENVHTILDQTMILKKERVYEQEVQAIQEPAAPYSPKDPPADILIKGEEGGNKELEDAFLEIRKLKEENNNLKEQNRKKAELLKILKAQTKMKVVKDLITSFEKEKTKEIKLFSTEE
jgi:hypothetical protein